MNGFVAPGRILAVLAATAAVALPLSAIARPPLAALVSHIGTASADQLTFEQAMAGVCAGALVGCYAVWVLGVLLAVLDVLLSGPPRAAVRRVPCPRLARVLAASVLGASLAVSSPSWADAPHDARHTAPAGTAPSHVLTGLPLPERVATGPASPVQAVAAPAAHRHEVSRGDTLWAVAARALPPRAPDAAVDRAWRRIAAANPGVVDDPDLIFPGTVLRVPPLDDLLGKDQT